MFIDPRPWELIPREVTRSLLARVEDEEGGPLL
jgi:hypothetical protein